MPKASLRENLSYRIDSSLRSEWPIVFGAFIILKPSNSINVILGSFYGTDYSN